MNSKIIEEKVGEVARIAKVTEEIRNGLRSVDVCDKCGRPVESKNDATRLDFLRGYIMAFMAIPRHLLPVVENGVVVCEGSPSRAQYLEGQPRDKRASYPYQQKSEALVRDAYDRLVLESAKLEN